MPRLAPWKTLVAPENRKPGEGVPLWQPPPWGRDRKPRYREPSAVCSPAESVDQISLPEDPRRVGVAVRAGPVAVVLAERVRLGIFQHRTQPLGLRAAPFCRHD